MKSRMRKRGEWTEKKDDDRKEVLAPPEKKSELNPPEPKKELSHEERKELEDCRARLAEAKERLLRLQAEFENFKKRAAKENDMVRESASAEAMLKILPIVDEFEIAISHMDKAPAKEFKHGIELIYAKLKDMLRKDGIEEMTALGEGFDPYKHDALRQGEGEEGKVVEVVVKGYTFRGKVLRHAKVVVGKGKEADRHGD